MALQQQSTPTTAVAAPAPAVAAPAPANDFGSNSEIASGVSDGGSQTPTLARAASAQTAAPTAPPLKNATYKAAYARNDRQTDAMKFQATSKQAGELAFFEKEWKANAGRYRTVAAKSGVPAELVAAIHYREGSCNFGTYLHNGDPLGKRTTHVPAGILFYDWESAAVHALGMKNAARLDLGLTSGSTDSAAIATYAEAYNGFGYANKGRVSPYVYAGTDQYKGGMYVADGQFSATAVDGRPGILACMNKIGFKFDSGMLNTIGQGQGGQDQGQNAPAPAPSASRVSGSPLLRDGSKGPNVSALQTALKSLGYSVGAVDGDFGPNTEAAVRAFQQRHGLKIDGVVGPNTATAINSALDGKQPQGGNTPTTLSTSRMLKSGSNGADVTALQRVLSSKGYDVGPIDGDFGPKTEAAVRAFQSRNGLAIDGIVGPATLAKLNGTAAPAPTGGNRPPSVAPAPTGGTTPPPQPGQTGLAAERGALAAKSAELEYNAGVARYGAGKSWETAGANQGAMVDKYQTANKDSASSDNPWCGMFAGYNYQQAGIRKEIIDNLVFWSGLRLNLFFTQGKYISSKGKAGDWWSSHKTLDMRGIGAGSRRLEALKGYNPRPGDIVLFRSDFSHVGMVDSFDPATGKLFVMEGNAGDRVQANAYTTGSESITFIGRFNDNDFDGGVSTSVQNAADPAIRFSDGSLGKTS